MGTNQIQEAVARYEKTIKKAAEDYEAVLSSAEAELKAILVTGEVSSPQTDMVSMTRSDYEQLQSQLARVAKFIEQHPELK